MLVKYYQENLILKVSWHGVRAFVTRNMYLPILIDQCQKVSMEKFESPVVDSVIRTN